MKIGIFDTDWLSAIDWLFVFIVESLRVIAETFHAAKKLISEDVLVTDKKLDKYEVCSLFCYFLPPAVFLARSRFSIPM